MSRKQLRKRRSNDPNKPAVRYTNGYCHHDPFRHLRDDELAEFISEELRERKTDVIRKTVQTLGRQKTLHIFQETVRELRHGGAHLWVKDGSRRRSPGGVFFTIIRENPDPDIAQQYRTIKQADVEEQEKQWIKRKRQRIRKAQGQNNSKEAERPPTERASEQETTIKESQHITASLQVSTRANHTNKPVLAQGKDRSSTDRLDKHVTLKTKGRD